MPSLSNGCGVEDFGTGDFGRGGLVVVCVEVIVIAVVVGVASVFAAAFEVVVGDTLNNDDAPDGLKKRRGDNTAATNGD